jgi:hypothetical protein
MIKSGQASKDYIDESVCTPPTIVTTHHTHFVPCIAHISMNPLVINILRA